MAETTQKYLPHYYSISNIALRLICCLKTKVNDVIIQNIKEIRRSKIRLKEIKTRYSLTSIELKLKEHQ